jgi:hypothetical protein
MRTTMVVSMALGRGPALYTGTGLAAGKLFEGAPRLGLGLAALGRPGYINLGRERDFGSRRSPDAMKEATFEVDSVLKCDGLLM